MVAGLLAFLARIWLRFFAFLPRRRAIFWEVGVPLSGFRPIVFRPACFSSVLRFAENAPRRCCTRGASACKRRTGLSPTCSCHACTYKCLRACRGTRRFLYAVYTGEAFFALKHTRQLVSLNAAATWRRLNAKVELLLLPLAEIFVFGGKKKTDNINFVFVFIRIHEYETG